MDLEVNMRQRILGLTLGLSFALLPLLARGSDLQGTDPRTGKTPPPPAKEDCGCGNHGTTVQFLDSPSEAARKARKEEKLVFVLHVSGLFEDPKLT